MINSQIYANIRQEFSDRLILLKNKLIKRQNPFKVMSGKVSVAIGVRRSGKTYLMYEKIMALLDAGIPLARILYLNLEDDRLQPKKIDMMRDLIDYFFRESPDNHNQCVYFFFDEIQEVEDWSALIRRLVDASACEIYLTGSSAKLLSTEIASKMRGRSLSTTIWPFSFSEFLVTQKIDFPEHRHSDKFYHMLLQQLEYYLLRGGFPEIVMQPTPEWNFVLQEYVDIAILRDIVERHAIKNIQMVRYLVRTLLVNISASFSVNKFYNDLKSQGYAVGKETLYEYLGYIEDCFLAFAVPLFSDSLRKVQVNPRKIYTCDTGLSVAYQFGFSNNIGRLFENLIYLELRRKALEVFFYKTQTDYEVDFLAVYPGGKKKLFQVAWDISDTETINREVRALEVAKIELAIEGELITPQTFLTNSDILNG